MPPRYLCRRALAPLLGLGACIAWAAMAPVIAQSIGGGEEALAYEIRLDPGRDPVRAEAPVPAGESGPSHHTRLGLDALVPGYADGTPHTRVVHGIVAESGQWPSAVSLDIVKDGATAGALCAGTVIDPHWVLTAAHCVFDRFRGGVKAVRAVTAYTRSNVPHRGEPRRVASVVVHPLFAVVPRLGRSSPGLINDVALLELEAPTTAPRQALLADAGQPAALTAGTIATLVGWGLTKPRRPDERSDLASLSRVLLRADVPVADRRTCDAFLTFPGDLSTEALFCAGDARGGADACNGDSGGPIFVQGPAGQPIQAGVVSWGDGCAYPGAYGAYAAVGHFEPWIRRYAPQAVWVRPGGTQADVLAEISGASPGGPAAPYGQVAVDLQVHACNGVAAVVPPGASGTSANRVRIGACMTVLVTSGAAGDLAVFNRDAAGAVLQIFPNRYSGRQVGQTPTRVRAGQIVRIPGDADGFNFRIAGPPGRNEIIAVIVPEAADLDGLTRPSADMRAIDDFAGLLGRVAERTRRVEIEPRAPRAVGTRQYEVMD